MPEEGRALVMAIDASITGTAVVLLGKDMEIRKEFQTKATDWEKGLQGRFERYHWIVNQVSTLAREHAPHMLLIEDYAFNAKGRSTISLGELGGLLRDSVRPFPDFIGEVPPSVLKKFATGRGNAGKAEVVSALSARYGVKFKTDNEADAFALAKLGMVVARYEEAQTKQQREAAATVLALIQ